MKNQGVKSTIARVRKYLNADALNTSIKDKFTEVFDPRCQKDVNLYLSDALMSGYAMFQFKDPSLLAFDRRCKYESGWKDIFNKRFNLNQIRPGEKE